MANRRFGGPQRGNRGYNQNNVNPWQGGSAPAGPMPNNNIQTQLALALTSLLQPKQQMNDNPPSLLSLNPSQGYFNEGYGSGGRFGNRGRDMRRPEPYNKNRGGNWRDNKGGKGFSGRNPIRFNKDKKQDKKDDIKKKEEKSNEEGREEGEGEKRDWKTEKNEESAELEESKDGEKKEDKKDRSKYAGLPASMLHCFICNKSMWDGESFQNHIGGTAHVQMLNSAEESFRIVVNILRENMRLAEEKEMIELNRMVRSNRKYVHKMKEPQSHCNMCDMKFLGKIIAHRKTAGHQRLKRYLHPKCEICNLEYPSRIEWVEHRFTPEHMLKLKETMESRAGGADGNIIEETVELELEPLLDESLQSECENPVMELDETLDNLQNRLPAYKKNRQVGIKSLKEAQGFICEICHRFFESEELAQIHLKTEGHYHSFVTALKKKAKRAAAEKADDDGNWKRRKTENGEEGEKGEGDDDMKGDSNGADEMYDPEEACNEDSGVQDEGAKDDDDKEDKWAEVDAIIESGEHVNAKEEPEEEEEIKSPMKRAAPQRGGGARNGAGPKSRTRGRK